MANVAKISESAKASKTSKEVTLKAKVTAPAPTKEEKTAPAFEDKTPTLNADPAKIWDALCNSLGVEERVRRTERDANTIDRQFFGVARATTLALLAGGQDTILERVKNLESDTPKKVATLLSKGYPRQAVTTYFELCILMGVHFSEEAFEACYICTESVKERGTLLGSKILERAKDLNFEEDDDAKKWVNRFSSSDIKDKDILAYIRANPCTYEEAITALSKGGAKMKLDFNELKKIGIYEINYTSNSAVKDYVYFVIK